MKTKHFWISAITLMLLAGQTAHLRAAGNVTSVLVEDELFIIGDREANNIYVNGDLETLSLTIEGDLSEAIPLADVANVSIISGGGNDVVSVHGTVLGSVEISTGAADDFVGVFAAMILGDLSIESGQGHDHILVGYLSVTGEMRVSSGHGVDEIEFEGCDVGGNLDINTGGNNDLVKVFFPVNIGGNLTMELGQGDDVLILGDPAASPLLVVSGTAIFHGGQGNNRIELFSAGPFDDLEDVIVADEGFEIVDFNVFVY